MAGEPMHVVCRHVKDLTHRAHLVRGGARVDVTLGVLEGVQTSLRTERGWAEIFVP